MRVISYSPNVQEFRYCGIHSNMINYPQGRNVSIIITNPAGTRIKYLSSAIIFYSVIDTQRILSLPKDNFKWRILVWTLCLEQNNISVMKFLMITKKYETFIINFTIDPDISIQLFDGQGTLSSNIFKNNQETYVTSTFQSIIHMWIPLEKNVRAECGFSTQSIHISKDIELNGSLPHLISHTFAKYESWRLLSHSNINITIIKLTYSGFNDPLCTFAGLAVYALNVDSNTDIINECFSFKYQTYRDIYSRSNKTLLVLYSYKEYGNVSITMQLSTTQCKPVTINTCALSYLCQLPNNTLCTEHREQISSLNLKPTKISTDFPISVNPGKCFVFQMVTVTDRHSLEGFPLDCKINFRHIDILDENVHIQFVMKTFLHCKYLLLFIIQYEFICDIIEGKKRNILLTLYIVLLL